MARVNRDTSQYFTTPVTDWYLDIWQPRTIKVSEFDKQVAIPAEYDKRPDLMSYNEYGTAKLWWLFAVRNPDDLIDPIEDFTAGKIIYIPENILTK